MELLTKDEIFHIIKQLGHFEARSWSVNEYSDELIGFLGEHLTLTVEVATGTVLKFFVKCLPRFDEWKASYIRQTTFFEKEYAMLNSLFRQFGKGTQKWRPTVFFVKKELFVFEDVVQLGYSMPRNRDTLTLEEVYACVETMSRFHAQSYLYEEKKSQELNRPYRIWEDHSDHLREPSDANKYWRDTGINAVIEYLKVYSKYKTLPNFTQNIESSIRKLFESALLLMQPHKRYRNVVVHRDLWMNNLFFKTEPNGALNALFVDFQTVLYCPPTLDLSSFLYFNTRRNFREKYLNKLIDLYYDTLYIELKMSNIDIANIMDKETLKSCYEDTIMFGISQGALIAPVTLIGKEMKENIFSHPDKVNQFYEVSRTDEFITIAKNDERYRHHVTELLDEMVEKYVVNPTYIVQ